MPEDRIEITAEMLREALGSASFKLTMAERQELAKRLNKATTPKSWTVAISDGEGATSAYGVPTVFYKDKLVRLEVYTGVAKPDAARRLQIAELVAEHLNDRGVEV